MASGGHEYDQVCQTRLVFDEKQECDHWVNLANKAINGSFRGEAYYLFQLSRNDYDKVWTALLSVVWAKSFLLYALTLY